MNFDATFRFLCRSWILQNPYVSFNFSKTGNPNQSITSRLSSNILGKSLFYSELYIEHRQKLGTRATYKQ